MIPGYSFHLSHSESASGDCTELLVASHDRELWVDGGKVDSPSISTAWGGLQEGAGIGNVWAYQDFLLFGCNMVYYWMNVSLFLQGSQMLPWSWAGGPVG